MNNEKVFDSHCIILDNRNHCELTGIIDVISFDDTSVFASSSLGDIEIEGEELKIGNFSAEKGTLSISGKISGIYYLEISNKKHNPKKRGSKKSV